MSLRLVPRRDERWGTPTFSASTPTRRSPRTGGGASSTTISRSSISYGLLHPSRTGSPAGMTPRAAAPRSFSSGSRAAGGLYDHMLSASHLNSRVNASGRMPHSMACGKALAGEGASPSKPSGASSRPASTASPVLYGSHVSQRTPTRGEGRVQPRASYHSSLGVSYSESPILRSRAGAARSPTHASAGRAERVLSSSAFARAAPNRRASAIGSLGAGDGSMAIDAMRSSMSLVPDKENLAPSPAPCSPRLTRFTTSASGTVRYDAVGAVTGPSRGHSTPARKKTPTAAAASPRTSSPYGAPRPSTGALAARAAELPFGKRSQAASAATPMRSAATSVSTATTAFLRSYSSRTHGQLAAGDAVGSAVRRNSIGVAAVFLGAGQASEAASSMSTSTSVGTRRSCTLTTYADDADCQWNSRETPASYPPKTTATPYAREPLATTALSAATPVKRTLLANGTHLHASRLEPRRKSPVGYSPSKSGASHVRGVARPPSPAARTPPRATHAPLPLHTARSDRHAGPGHRTPGAKSAAAVTTTTRLPLPVAAYQDPNTAPPADCGITRVQRPGAVATAAAGNSTPRRLALYGGGGKNTPRSRAAAAVLAATPAPRAATAAPSDAAARPTDQEPLLPYHSLQHRPLLVLDLDETLVHAAVETPEGPYELSFAVPIGDSQSVNVFVAIRPHAREFLQLVSSWFEVCVFTASVTHYADTVLDYLDPGRKLVHHRLYRQHCTMLNGTYVKDLSRMGRPLSRILIVDNSAAAYLLHPGNGMPIESWFDDEHDTELHSLVGPLEHYYKYGDARSTVARYVS